MLDILNVEKTFNPGTINEKKALNGINLHLDEGDFVTVIGGNGAGKSTMLNMIAGVYPVDCGNIIVDGIDVTSMPEMTSILRQMDALLSETEILWNRSGSLLIR